MHRVTEYSASSRRALALAGVLMATTALAGCQWHRDTSYSAAAPIHYDQRHPITVGYKPVDLIVYPDAHVGGLNAEDKTAVATLARQYRNTGNGAIHLQAPSGAGNEGAVQQSAVQIRQILSREGVDPSVVAVHTYRADGRHGNAPMKLVFYRYAAEAGPCGEWPRNLSHNPQNKEWHNFGCAQQRNLAAMVEDPRDITGPRGHGPRDAMRRTTVQDTYRKGEDPSTIYDDNGAQVSEVGSQ